jgi:hypothetical protein
MSVFNGVLKMGSWSYRSVASINREIDDEFDFHIESQTKDLVAGGMKPEQATEEALRKFGSRDRIRRECQRIGLGQNLWLAIAMSVLMAGSLGAIGWLSVLLNAANQQNLRMQAMLVSMDPTATLDSMDLTGEVTDSQGAAIVDAKVMLIFKSWPNGQYQQDAFDVTTDKDGKFRFEDLYDSSIQNAFLITILAEGQTMQGQYVQAKPNAKVKSFRFKLKPAIEKTFLLIGDDGNPLADTLVYPSKRKAKGSKDEILLYDQSVEAAGYATDSDGKVKMSLFEVGDTLELGIADFKPIKLTIDKEAEQKVKVQKKMTR